jgi:hypothetical protein
VESAEQGNEKYKTTEDIMKRSSTIITALILALAVVSMAFAEGNARKG